jgi:hypothetical protein
MMTIHRIGLGAGIAAWLAVAVAFPGRLPAQDHALPPPLPDQELPEVLTRGPIHEAFAEPVDLQVQEPVTAPAAPPEAMNEAPSAEQPAEGNAIWVPGYWAWDSDRGYIWISACWRTAPPGMYWVPGYWVQNGNQWQWVSGFWAPAGVREIEYLPPPPVLQNTEPAGAGPENGIWVAPCWYWYSGQYVLRQGYWLNAAPDWSWEPSHYVWTPRGHVFVPGHWDYAFEQRGILFAPVYFPPSYYVGSSRYVYTPNIILDLGLVLLNLFAYPRYNHYCFGDYYDDGYARIGIYPWYDCTVRFSWYDPIYQHQRWSHRRTDSRWDEHMREDYRNRYKDRDARPARTFREQDERQARLPEPQRVANRLAVRMSEVAAMKKQQARLLAVDANTRTRIERQGGELRQFQKDRIKWEAQGTLRGTPGGKSDVVIVPEDHRSVSDRGPVPGVVKPGKITDEIKPRDEGKPKDEIKPRDEGKPKDEIKPRDEGKPRDEIKPRDEGKPKDEIKIRDDGKTRDGVKIDREVRPSVTVVPLNPPVQPESPRFIPKRVEQPVVVKPEPVPPETPSVRMGVPAKTREDRTSEQKPVVIRTPEIRQPPPVIKPDVHESPPQRVTVQPAPQPIPQPAPQPRVRMTKPERVQIPAAPVVLPSQPAPAVATPPAPEGEFRHKRGGQAADEGGYPMDGRKK